MPRTLSHSIREIADQIDRPEWASVLWRAAKQLEMLYGFCGIQPDEVPDVQGVTTLEQGRQRGEKAVIVSTLYRAGGNKTLAAEWLGISRVSLHKSLRKHGMTGEHEDVTDV